MQLIDRYLQAVEFWLPNKNRADIVRELGDDIRAQVEERESELGRALNDSELAEILKQRGRPMLVAYRYHPQRSLIGPSWYPLYLFALKIAAVCYVLPWLAVWLVMRFVFPEVAAKYGFPAAGNIGTFWTLLFTVFGVVTLVFAALNRASAGQKSADSWDPRSLPQLYGHKRIPRANSTCEALVGAFGCACWLKIMALPMFFNDAHTHIQFSPWLRGYMWALFALAAASVALAIANWMRPYWTPTRYAVRATIHLCSGVVLALIARRPVIAELRSTLPSAQGAALQHSVNYIVSACLLAAVAIVIAMSGLDLLRMRRLRQSAAVTY